MRSRHALVLAGLFLASLALRPQIIGVGPLLLQVKEGLGSSHTVEGLLSSIPLLCMGLFAPVAALLAVRIGARAAIAWVVGLVAAGGLLRVAAPDAVVLLAFTLPIGIGIAVAGTLMPVAVKERFRTARASPPASTRRASRPAPPSQRRWPCPSPTGTGAGASRCSC